MWNSEHRIKVIVGHYGSGKTEIALNLALRLHQSGAPCALVDLDIVNPFFRSAEREELLKAQGVELLCPSFALSAVDIPALPAEILSVFERPELEVVIDVGGDDAGATALGIYAAHFQRVGYDLYYAVNVFRPRSSTVREILDMMARVRDHARLTPTGLINNANLGGLTEPQHLLEGQRVLEEVSRASGLPVVATAGLPEVLAQLPQVHGEKFPIDRLMKPEWMEL